MLRFWKSTVGIVLLLASLSVCASQNLDETVNALVQPATDLVSTFVFAKIPLLGTQVPWVVIWLVAGGLFCTLYFAFINIRGFKHAIALVRGDFSNPDHAGEVSHFQALATALSGTVGIGNIGGVAAAISIGGPGAAFWMIIAGVLGMSSKFCECTLGVKYRNEYPDGHVSGGPMYYLSKGFASLGWVKLGKFMGAFYAVGIFIGCLGIGNMFQSNQAFSQFVNVTGGETSWFADKGWLFGIVLAALVGFVIIGGIKSIARVTEKVVPFMAILYLSGASVILIMNFEALPWTINTIVTDAFNPAAVAGGWLGALIVGFQRAVFSNEAGIGSAAIAHAAVRTNEPVTEGIVAVLEPFIDTVIICSFTALVIVSTGYYVPGFFDNVGGTLQGIETTSAAFARNISWAPYFIAVAAILFAFSTMISWGYYGLKGWTYIFGESKAMDVLYKMIFCTFVALGCMIQLGAVLDFSDAMVFIICIPNILGIYFLAPTVKRELDKYLHKVKTGEIVNYRALRK